MRWAERNFATLELYLDLTADYLFTLSHLAIHHQPFWPVTDDVIPTNTALHCLIPDITYSSRINIHMGILRMLLHFCNFLFPLFGATGSGLDKVSSQIPAVYRVNHFLKTRYPKATAKCFTEGLKLWPAYVFWARGHVRQATDFFMEAVSTLKDKYDKAICLNELGRMMSWYGDRQYSEMIFRKSLDVVMDILQDRRLMREKRMNNLNPKLVQPSSFALMASVWDVGIMDRSSARGAKLSWQSVLKEYDTVSGRGVSIWYFHEAAMESQLCFHSTQPVNDTDPSMQKVSGNRSLTSQWLNDCEQFALKYAPDYPILYYHLSLINALAKLPDQSRKNFHNFLTNFAGIHEWHGHIPGNPLGLPVPMNHQPSPWKALINLMTDNMETAPVLPLCWRTRLLHPLFPYPNSKDTSYLADHCSEQINLHFTEDGYLTGDMLMDFPPMRCVLLDPFTGKVCFSQGSALAHYNSQFYCPTEYPAPFAAPQPLRLLTTDWCSVELMAGYSHDLSASYMYRISTSCYHTTLHWYGSDGSHAKLDLRKIIRKNVKDSLMSLFHTDKGPVIEDMIKRVETVFNNGLQISWRITNARFPLHKTFKFMKVDEKTSRRIRIRETTTVDFYLHLTHHCVIGDNTLLLTFQLDNDDKYHPNHVLVFVPCSSLDSFMNPVVHYSVDSCTVFLPEFKHVSCYHNNHLPHIRYVYTISVLIQPPWGRYAYCEYVMSQDVVRHQIFDEYGKVVFSEEDKLGRWITGPDSVKKFYDATNGDLLYKCIDEDSGLTSTIEGLRLPAVIWSPDASIILLGRQPYIHTLPGCIIVHTTAGVYTLDPVTLIPMPCKMPQARDDNSHSEDDGIPRPQFNIADCTLTILSVFDINYSSNKKKQDNDDKLLAEFLESLDSATPVTKATHTVEDDQSEPSINDSCCVAMAINSRLIIMKIFRCELMILIDVELPGMITEFHDTGGNGYLVASSVFHDRQREDVYWLSKEGRLLGVIPCLECGPHSFCTKFLEHKSSSEDDKDLSGTYTFFNDGYGGICSVRLTPF